MFDVRHNLDRPRCITRFGVAGFDVTRRLLRGNKLTIAGFGLTEMSIANTVFCFPPFCPLAGERRAKDDHDVICSRLAHEADAQNIKYQQ